MSVVLNDEMASVIILIFAKNHVGSNVFLFDRIPAAKLQNARRRFAPNMGVDEGVIMLLDGTVLGSSKDGILLTTRRLYNKNSFEKAEFMELADIKELTFKPHALAPEICAISAIGTMKKVISNIRAEAFFNSLQETILFLQNPAAYLAAHRNQQADASVAVTAPAPTRCNGCGAVGAWVVCEYCGSPMQ